MRHGKWRLGTRKDAIQAVITFFIFSLIVIIPGIFLFRVNILFGIVFVGIGCVLGIMGIDYIFKYIVNDDPYEFYIHVKTIPSHFKGSVVGLPLHFKDLTPEQLASFEKGVFPNNIENNMSTSNHMANSIHTSNIVPSRPNDNYNNGFVTSRPNSNYNNGFVTSRPNSNYQHTNEQRNTKGNSGESPLSLIPFLFTFGFIFFTILTSVLLRSEGEGFLVDLDAEAYMTAIYICIGFGLATLFFTFLFIKRIIKNVKSIYQDNNTHRSNNSYEYIEEIDNSNDDPFSKYD